MKAPWLTLAEAARALGLAPPGGSDEVSLAGVSTDSRTIKPGELFVALRGPNFDGHGFIAQAFEKGAAAALAGKGTRVPRGRPVLRVEDTLRSLGDLAAWFRRRRPLQVVAVTGSNGKTTTKEMIVRILKQKYRTHASAGNFNTLVGLPLSIFELRSSDQAAVLEMGMNHPGEIARLTEIAAPDVGLVTNVGPAHLQGLGSLRGVAQAKGELFRGLAPQTVAVVNLDDPLVMREAAVFKGKHITFGFTAKSDVHPRGLDRKGPGGRAFTLVTPLGQARVELALLGRHNVANALAAAAVGAAFGLSAQQTAEALAGFPAFPRRLQLRRLPGPVHLLDDTYNSNPVSAKLALEVLIGLPGRGRTLAVLGDMLELGKVSAAEHTRLGREAARLGVDVLVVVGPESRRLGLAAKNSDRPPRHVRWFTDQAEAAAWLAAELKPHDRVLVKGSRGMHLEDLVDRLISGGAT
ncbi:MAG: UDP-N-acetylmuramoyl-tripeptide--D-alanyl-D-alanine ligase [Thermodesulfobacteriota bacterium]